MGADNCNIHVRASDTDPWLLFHHLSGIERQDADRRSLHLKEAGFQVRIEAAENDQTEWHDLLLTISEKQLQPAVEELLKHLRAFCAGDADQTKVRRLLINVLANVRSLAAYFDPGLCVPLDRDDRSSPDRAK
jgi:hypothetical protein